MKQIKQLFLVGLSAFVLSGCGGSSGSSNNGGLVDKPTPKPTTQTLAGQVLDPEVNGAVVKVCHTTDSTNCLDSQTVTNFAGGFSLTVPIDLDLSIYAIYGTGGIDSKTDEKLNGLTFVSALALFEQNESIVVSPATTLVTQKMRQGSSKEDALKAIAAQLQLPEGELTDSPVKNKALQKKALLLTQIAMLRNGGFEDLSEHGDIDNMIENEVTDAKESKRLKLVKLAVESTDSTQAAVNQFVIMRKLLRSDLIKDSYDLDDETTRNNLVALANGVNEFLTTQNVAEVNQLQVNRVIVELKADQTLDLAASDFTMPTIEAKGVDYANLKKNILIDHKKDLSEALAEGSDAKRDYYYKSTASTYYRTQELLTGITDSATLDEIYEAIAEGYVDNNQPQYAISIANLKLFSPYKEADVLIEAVNKQIQLNQTTDVSESYVDQAFTTFKNVFEETGGDNIKSSHMNDFRGVYNAYAGLNNATKAESYYTYIDDLVEQVGDNYRPVLSIVVGLFQSADESIAAGNTDIAKSSLDKAVGYTASMPPNDKAKYPDNPEKWNYRAAVYGYGELSLRYLALGGQDNLQTARNLSEKAQSIRLDDSASGITEEPLFENGGMCARKDTSTRGDTYTRLNMIDAYLATEFNETEMQAYVDTICSDRNKAYAWLKYITKRAETNVQDAITIIDREFTSERFKKRLYSQKINALTLNGIKKSKPYVAYSLIKQGKLADAEIAINRAVEILDAAVKAGEETKESGKAYEYIRDGYSNFGWLYHLTGNSTKSLEMYNKAEAILSKDSSSNPNAHMTDPSYISYAYAYLAKSYGKSEQSDRALNAAKKAYQQALTISKNSTKISRITLATSLLTEIYTSEGVTELKPIVIEGLDDLYGIATGSTALIADSPQNDLIERNGLLDQLVIHYRSVNAYDKANQAIETLKQNAMALADPGDKTDAQKLVVKAYATMDEIEKAENYAKTEIEHKQEFLEALKDLASRVSSYDAFTGCSVASVDNDKDGKPDFYTKGATTEQIQECGLTQDDDSDNDGIIDTEDLTPFHNTNQAS